jgi:hypothetical protein
MEVRDLHRFLVGKREGKRLLGRARHGWEKILRWIDGRDGHRFLVGKPEV